MFFSPSIPEHIGVCSRVWGLSGEEPEDTPILYDPLTLASKVMFVVEQLECGAVVHRQFPVPDDRFQSRECDGHSFSLSVEILKLFTNVLTTS